VKDTASARGQHVVFTLQGQWLSLPAEEVVEIIRIRPITPVPGTAPIIAGIINLRGNIIPVIHLSVLCALEMSELGSKSRIVIVTSMGDRIGIIVDDVSMVVAVQEDQVEEMPNMPGFLQKEYFRGFIKSDGVIIGILYLDRIIQQQVGR
jgi:purine-binding chemotaxis protein CheW